MRVKEKIEVGDKVDIFFRTEDAFFNCEILHTPQATGDSWRIRTREGILVYMQSFETMHLKEQK